MIKQETNNSDAWDACPEGEIRQMVQRNRARRSRRKLARVSSGVAVVAVLLIVGVVGGRFWLDRQMQPAPAPAATDHLIAGISCADVIANLPAYGDGSLAREDEEIYDRVFHHLAKCHECRSKWREITLEETASTQMQREAIAWFEEQMVKQFARR